MCLLEGETNKLGPNHHSPVLVLQTLVLQATAVIRVSLGKLLSCTCEPCKPRFEVKNFTQNCKFHQTPTQYLSKLQQKYIVPLEPEQAMSIFAFDPFGTETTYFGRRKLGNGKHLSLEAYK